MTDARLTKLTGALLVAVRDQVDHLIGGGLVDKEQLRVTLAPAARKEAHAKLAEEGFSTRQIAAVTGASQTTVTRDLAEPNGSKFEPNGSALDLPIESPAPRGDAEILEHAKKIRAAKAESARGERIDNIAAISKGNAALDTKQRYPIIYADPPWQYENPPLGGGNRSIENHYPTMTPCRGR